MYFIPLGWSIKRSRGEAAASFANLTGENFFLANLFPVTIGNIIGGAVMVGMVYWFIYLRPDSSQHAIAKNPPPSI